MKVGIIIYSHTGNTLFVAQKLMQKLVTAGHSVNLEQVTSVSQESPSTGIIQLESKPDVSAYDVLIFGAPVNGLSLSPVMKVYLSQLPSLQMKKVGCFITQHFPYAWMGGNRTIRQMKEACKAKGVNVFETGIVNWSHKQRERKIEEVLEKMGRIISKD